MKIRTKLTLFFTMILFVLVLALSLWYQYRLSHVLRQETLKNLDMFVESFFRPERPERSRIPERSEKIERPENNEKRFWNEEDIHRFKLKLNRIQNRDDFSRLLNRYSWFALYDNDFNVIEESIFAKMYKLNNLKSYLNKKYFTTRLIVSSQYFKTELMEMRPEFKFLIEQGFYADTNKDNYTFYCVGKTSVINTQSGKLYFMVLLSDNKNVEYLEKTLINVIFSLLILICIIILLGLLYSKYSLNPINKIIHDLNNISEQNLSQRIISNVNNKDEIAEISLSINNLLDRIENAFNMEKQFISDVSHEFKTPISILQLNTESISNNPHLTNEEIDKITSSLEILYSLDFFIEKLLYLSRLESNLCPFNPKKISMKKLLSSILDNLKSIADLKKLKLALNMKDKDLTITGDRELLYIALYNIVENALKYTSEGHVLLNVTKHNDKVRLIIEDTGIGIPQDKINKIFDKFYRIDPSRQDDKSYGIGLTTTKRILDIHEAKIKINSIQNIKTEFIIDFRCNL